MFVTKFMLAVVFVVYQYLTIPILQDHGVKPPLARADAKKKPAQNQKDPAKDILRKGVDKTIQPREQDLKMQLPAVAPDKEPPAIAPFFIGISSKGEVWINTGPAKEIVETDVQKRNLPTLRGRLKTYSNVAKAAGQEPVVQIWADKAAQQIRVVDVLNALAAEKVSKVTFTDLVDEQR